MQSTLLACAALALAAAVAVLPGTAQACDGPTQASPTDSKGKAGIQFSNRTKHPMRVFWSDFEGNLKPYSGWIEPGDMVRGITTTVGHRWYVLIDAPGGEVCAGPIWADYASQTCDMLIFYDGRFGDDLSMSGVYCDFEN